jgi:hypothetical protein
MREEAWQSYTVSWPRTLRITMHMCAVLAQADEPICISLLDALRSCCASNACTDRRECGHRHWGDAGPVLSLRAGRRRGECHRVHPAPACAHAPTGSSASLFRTVSLRRLYNRDGTHARGQPAHYTHDAILPTARTTVCTLSSAVSNSTLPPHSCYPVD